MLKLSPDDVKSTVNTIFVEDGKKEKEPENIVQRLCYACLKFIGRPVMVPNTVSKEVTYYTYKIAGIDTMLAECKRDFETARPELMRPFVLWLIKQTTSYTQGTNNFQNQLLFSYKAALDSAKEALERSGKPDVKAWELTDEKLKTLEKQFASIKKELNEVQA
jgi:hypothetical protein